MEMAMENEKTPRTHSEPFPRSVEELVALFKRTVALPDVEEITVTPKEFRVRRMVREGEHVLPAEGSANENIDPEFILTQLAQHDALDELAFDPEAHPYRNILKACGKVSSRQLIPAFLFAPEGIWVSAFFDLPEDPPPSHVLGMRVVYSTSEFYSEKLVVVGSPTSFLSDCSYGVILDMGV